VLRGGRRVLTRASAGANHNTLVRAARASRSGAVSTPRRSATGRPTGGGGSGGDGRRCSSTKTTKATHASPRPPRGRSQASAQQTTRNAEAAACSGDGEAAGRAVSRSAAGDGAHSATQRGGRPTPRTMRRRTR
jgi:hypothetical protein